MKISFIAKLANFILKKTKPGYMDSQSDVEEFLLKKSNQQKKYVKSIFKSFDSLRKIKALENPRLY